MKCCNVITAFVICFVDAVVIVDNNEIPRSTAEAISAATAAQLVNPLTKEQLQQALIYLLQVLWLRILMIVYFLGYDQGLF